MHAELRERGARGTETIELPASVSGTESNVPERLGGEPGVHAAPSAAPGSGRSVMWLARIAAAPCVLPGSVAELPLATESARPPPSGLGWVPLVSRVVSRSQRRSSGGEQRTAANAGARRGFEERSPCERFTRATVSPPSGCTCHAATRPSSRRRDPCVLHAPSNSPDVMVRRGRMRRASRRPLCGPCSYGPALTASASATVSVGSSPARKPPSSL